MPEVPSWTRRRLLASAGTGLAVLSAPGWLTGCTSDGPGPNRPTSPSPTPDPDPPLVKAALEDEQRLVATYQALLTRFPPLAASLGAVLEDHRAHLAALTGDRPGTSPGTSPSAGPTGTSPATSTPPTSTLPTTTLPTTTPAASGTNSPLPLPADPRAAVTQLVTLEQQSAEARLRQVPRASGQLARTLASIAASEATHAALLPAVATRNLASASASAAVSRAAAEKSSGAH